MSLKKVLAPVPLVAVILCGARPGSGQSEPSATPASAPPLGATAPASAPALPEPQATTVPAPAAAPSAPVLPPSEEVAKLYRDRLARSLAQRARSMLQREYVFIGMLEAGQCLMEQSVALAPDNPFIWRLALDYAVTMEDGDARAQALIRRGLARLTQLEPEDEVMRLRRLLATVESKQTVEERSAVLESLLKPENIDRIGKGVAARLAFDYALLLRRAGDQTGFEKQLIRAIDLDPCFPEATEVAAGYFRMQAPSVPAEAAALRTAVLANPTCEPAALGLAELCMRSGAYHAAADILNVEAELLSTDFPDLGFDTLLSDLTMAFWGSDRTLEALSVGRKRQEGLNRVFRQTVERGGSTLRVEDLRKLAYPMALPLAGTVAALTHSVFPEQAADTTRAAAVSVETTLRAMDEQGASAEEKAEVMLEGAFVQLWLDGDVEQARKWIDAAAAVAPLSDTARARFDGFLALRAGDAAKARELLAPRVAEDLPSKLGLALADQKLGDSKSAARGLLEIARNEPANAIGLWSRDQLRRIVGQPVAVRASAQEVEDAAVLPQDFLQLMRGDRTRILLGIRPRGTDLTPWDPMIFDIDITNRSEWPLAITPQGPLADTATVTAAVNVPGQPITQPPFALLSIARRFSLAPGATMTVPIDISLTDASFAMRDDALSGAFMSIHPILNWRTTERGLEPGPLGIEAESPLVHVRGEKVGREWIAAAVADLSDPARVPDPAQLVALASVVARASKDPERFSEEEKSELKAAPPVLVAATRRLWPEARAWLIFGLPKGELRELRARPDASVQAAGTPPAQAAGTPSAPTIVGVETVSAAPELTELDALLAADEHPLVRMSWIAVRVKRPEDPILERTGSHPDPALSEYARDSLSWMRDVAEERRRKLNLTK